MIRRSAQHIAFLLLGAAIVSSVILLGSLHQSCSVSSSLQYSDDPRQPPPPPQVVGDPSVGGENAKIAPDTIEHAFQLSKNDAGSERRCRLEPLHTHPHAGARDAQGCAGYVHDTKFLRNHQLAITWNPQEGNGTTICDEEPGQGAEGVEGWKALKKIRVVPPSPSHPKVLCIVYTHSGRHSILRSVVETWGGQCDGFLATSNLTDPSLGAVNVLHRGRESYGNMWEKVRSTWSYVYQNYLDEYDWFYIAGDDTFVIVSNLQNALLDYQVDEKPMYVGFTMIRSPYKKKIYCGGGAGYTLNRKALRVLIEERYSKPFCGVDLENLNLTAPDEDRIVSDCLREVANCTHSVDENDETRFHILTPGYHAMWSRQDPSNWKADDLLEFHHITSTRKEKLESVSETSVSFHLMHPSKLKHFAPPESIWLDNGMRRLHALVHGLCGNLWTSAIGGIAQPHLPVKKVRNQVLSVMATKASESDIVEVNIEKTKDQPAIFHCGRFAGFPEYEGFMRRVLPEYQWVDIETSLHKGRMLGKKAPVDRPFNIFLQHFDHRCSDWGQRWVWQMFSGKSVFVFPESHSYSRPTPREQFIELGPMTPTYKNHMRLTYMQVTFCKFLNPARRKALFHRRPKTTGDNFLIYAHHNCVDFREDAFAEMSKIGPVHFGGKCDGSKGLNSMSAVGTYIDNAVKRRNFQANTKFFSTYKFCLVMEHSNQPSGYITEKILMAFWAGCIPIYYGTDHIFNIFNSKAFVFYNISNPTPALELVKSLHENNTLFEATMNERILANGKQTIEDYFSFDDEIGEGKLKKQIRSLIGLDNVRFTPISV